MYLKYFTCNVETNEEKYEKKRDYQKWCHIHPLGTILLLYNVIV